MPTDSLSSCAADCRLVGRREFLGQGLALAAMAALVACGGSDITSPTLSGPATVKVTDYAALNAVGGIATMRVSGADIAVVRTAASTYIALSRTCPHQGSTVNVTSGSFTCPNHGARFSANGTWIGGERTSSLHSYSTSFDASTGLLTIS
ncbi:MAG: Rieske [2Fe-2S] iron-sulfur protein [Gemmatimonadetes bacterium]|nr:Rieske [2Fe-2S] iron-sulfur protein [Gemmatimonadota bacterium]